MNTNVNFEEIINDVKVRDKMASRVEVLDTVKAIFLIPRMETFTIKQMAEWYKVEPKTIRRIYQSCHEEFERDGTRLVPLSEVNSVFTGESASGTQMSTLPKINKSRYGVEIQLDNETWIKIPNTGVVMFPKRSVLRMGMLLQHSEVAKEVRTQLLNVFEKAETGEPVNVVEEIDREKELLNNVALAWASGDMMKFAEATMELNQYKDRHINQLKEANATLHKENTELTDQNKVLTDDNNILAGDILAWSNRASANKIVRLMAATLNWNFGSAWREVYNELNYRYGINLTMRWTHDGKPKNKPYLNYLHDNEWDKLYKTVAAMLQKRYVNPSKIFAQAKLELKESDGKD